MARTNRSPPATRDDPRLVAEHKCSECLFTTQRIVSPERAAQIIKETTQKQTFFHCHMWSKANPQKLKLKRLRHPEKYRARYILGNALQRRELVKPTLCEQCGHPGRIHGHHPDYSQPLSVQWLCHNCHNSLHKKLISGVHV